jgi:flagellar basal body rod protein FlgF
VFGILDNAVRKRLLRDPKLTLQTAIEKVRSAELTNAQLKQIKADQKITELEGFLEKPLLAALKRLQRIIMQLRKYNLEVVYKHG